MDMDVNDVNNIQSIHHLAAQFVLMATFVSIIAAMYVLETSNYTHVCIYAL